MMTEMGAGVGVATNFGQIPDDLDSFKPISFSSKKRALELLPRP
jgi:hypothetical protein